MSRATTIPFRRACWPSITYVSGVYAMRNLVFSLCWISVALVGAAHAAAADTEEGFRPLFNGKDLTGWHLRNPDGHNSWTVEDGILKNTVGEGEHGTDLVTDKKFW